MKLLSFTKEGRYALGIHTEAGIIDIEQALQSYPAQSDIPTTVMEVIEGGDAAVQALNEYVQSLPTGGNQPFCSGWSRHSMGTLRNTSEQNHLCWLELSQACRRDECADSCLSDSVQQV